MVPNKANLIEHLSSFLDETIEELLKPIDLWLFSRF
jgi:hypothetical protein